MDALGESLESKLLAVTIEDLRDLAERLQAAEARLAAAEQAVADDKARRARQGLFARLSDLVSETLPEMALTNATEVMEKLRELAGRNVARWLELRPAELAAADAGTAERNVIVRRYLDLSRRHDKLLGWYKLADAAVSVTEHAARRCRTAAHGELADALTNSTAMSLGSATATSVANDAVQDARQAIARLRAALPRHGATMQVKDVDDSFDTVIDVLFQPDVDILSWVNMGRLEAAAEKLEITARVLTPVRVYLGQKADATLAELEPMTAEGQSVVDSYAAAARDELPERLKSFVAMT